MYYSLQQAKADANLIGLNQDIDISSSSSTIINNIRDNDILSILVMNNLKTQRILNYQDSALTVEFEILSDQKFNYNDTNIIQNSSNTQTAQSITKNTTITTTNKNKININESISLWNYLPITLCVKSLPNMHTNYSNSSSSDNSIKQLQRDIQRDQILINGELLIGADSGLEGAMNLLNKTIDSILSECDIPLLDKLAPIQPSLKTNYCHSILQTACRTHSGGISYSGLQTALSQYSNIAKSSSLSSVAGTSVSLTDTKPVQFSSSSSSLSQKQKLKTDSNSTSIDDNDDNYDILSQCIIVPQSHLAPPLRLRLSVCKFGIDIDNYYKEIRISTDTKATNNETDNIKIKSNEESSPSSSSSSFLSILGRRIRQSLSSRNAATTATVSTNIVDTATAVAGGVSTDCEGTECGSTTATSTCYNSSNDLHSSHSATTAMTATTATHSRLISQASHPDTHTTSSSDHTNNNTNSSTTHTDSHPYSQPPSHSHSHSDTVNSWGVKCAVECVTVFLLKPIHDDRTHTQPFMNTNIQVTYYNTIVLPLSLTAATATTGTTGTTTVTANTTTDKKKIAATSSVVPHIITVPEQQQQCQYQSVCEHIVNSGQVTVAVYCDNSISQDDSNSDTE